MDVVDGLVLTLSPDEVTVLRRDLGEAIRYGYVARGRDVPRVLLELAQRLAGSERFSDSSQVRDSVRTAGFSDGALLPVSEQPAGLTITEAAALAGVSQSFMYRVVRRGDVDKSASRGPRGARRVDIPSLNAWIVSRRRKDRDHKAA